MERGSLGIGNGDEEGERERVRVVIGVIRNQILNKLSESISHNFFIQKGLI